MVKFSFGSPEAVEISTEICQNLENRILQVRLKGTYARPVWGDPEGNRTEVKISAHWWTRKRMITLPQAKGAPNANSARSGRSSVVFLSLTAAVVILGVAAWLRFSSSPAKSPASVRGEASIDELE